jgi:hypothetical protein
MRTAGCPYGKELGFCLTSSVKINSGEVIHLQVQKQNSNNNNNNESL